VVLFTGAVSLGTSLLFGVAPALRATRPEIASTLRAGGRLTTGAGSRPARLLVMGQVALSLVLVVGAGLFLRSLRALSTMDLGFAREHLVSVSLSTRGREKDRALHQRLVALAEGLPDVRAASLAQCGLVTNCRPTSNHLSVTGYEPAPGENISVRVNRVGPRYFQTVGIPVVAGRDFHESDHDNGPAVAIVNQAFVRRYFAGRDPIGQRYGGGTPRIEIVGVVRDARTSLVQEAPVTTAYHPLARDGAGAGALELRTAGDPGVLAAALGRVLAEREPGVRVERVRTISEQIERNLVQERAVASLTSVLGLLALALACFGLYGLTSYAVAGRIAEIGIRTALGASPGLLLRMVLGESLRLVVVGLGPGLTLVLPGARLLTDQLHGVKATDPATVLLSAVALTASALLAAYLPARRAARVNPLVALRAECSLLGGRAATLKSRAELGDVSWVASRGDGALGAPI
jgi:predicted permease